MRRRKKSLLYKPNLTKRLLRPKRQLKSLNRKREKQRKLLPKSLDLSKKLLPLLRPKELDLRKPKLRE